MSTPCVFSKVSITPMYEGCVCLQGFAPDGSSNTFYLQGESLQEMADKLWICGVKPSAVKAVAEAKPVDAAYVDLARLDRIKAYVRHLEGVVAGLLAGLAEMPAK